MTLVGIPLTQLLAIFGAVGGAVTVLYILKLRRRRISVPFAQLWYRVLKERTSDSLFKRMKRLISLLVQLAFIFLLVASLGNPKLSSSMIEERRVVMLIDTSASMKARDIDGNTRMNAALSQARKIIAGLNNADSMMIVRMDAQITPVTRFTSDPKELLSAIGNLKASDTRADLSRGLQFAKDALAGRKNPMLILIGDGAYEKDLLSRVLLDKRSGPKVELKKADAKKADAKKTDAKKADAKKADAKKADARKVASKKPDSKTKPGAKPAAKEPASKTTPKTKVAATGTGPKGKGKGKETKSGPHKDDLDVIDLRGMRVHYVGIGKSRDNIAIVAFNARRYPTNKLSFEIFLEVVNYRDKPAKVDLQLMSDGMLNDVKRLELAPGERRRYTCSPADRKQGKKTWCDMAASGELLEARLIAPGSTESNKKKLDSFPLDDHAYALLPRREKMRVLVVSAGNLFLEGALLLDENLQLKIIKPQQFKKESLRAMDAVVFDSFAPKERPTINTLYVNPPETLETFKIKGSINRPMVTEQKTDHPVMRFIQLKDVNISDSVRFVRRRGDVALAAALKQPVLIAREDKGRRAVALGFDPRRSDLPLRVAFPLLVINTFNWFSGEGEGLITTYTTGQSWRVPLGRRDEKADAISVLTPSKGKLKAPISGNSAVLHGREVGIYELGNGKNKIRIAANLADPKNPMSSRARAW
jgi:hypothetical protein